MSTVESLLPAGAAPRFPDWEKIDTGPLSWVMEEIRSALDLSIESLREFSVHLDDGTLLRMARTHLHQAHGALQIVGIEGVQRITEEVERLYDQFETNPQQCTNESVGAIGTAFRGVVAYLEELLSGAPHQPVKLFPCYRPLLGLLGASRIHPADLFYPDLSIRPPRIDTAVVVLSPEELGLERTRFEKGLLAFLKDDSDRDAIMQMYTAIKTLDAVPKQGQTRVFWWVAHVFFEGLANDAISTTDINIKRLVAAINLQISHFVKHQSGIAENLLRDMLFFLARAPSLTEGIITVKKVYQLENSLPTEFETNQYQEIDHAALRLAKEQLANVKEIWGTLATTAIQNTPATQTTFTSAITKLLEQCNQLQIGGLSEVASALQYVATSLGQLPALGEMLTLDVATAMLFLGNALDNAAKLDQQFETRAQAVATRLRDGIVGRAPSGESMPWLDEIARQAQERLTMATFVHEMQANLRSVEQILDAFFRTPSQRSELTQAEKLLSQIGGAFSVLGHEQAGQAINLGLQTLRQFANPDYQPEQSEFENLAQTLSALGFYVEDLLHQVHSGHQLRTTFHFAAGDGTFTADLHSIENTVSPNDENDLVVTSETLEDLGFVATDLIPQAELSQAESAAPASLIQTTPSLPTIHLEVSDHETDPELLQIFLDEAQEVLAYARQAFSELAVDTHPKEPLTIVRRAFHTLKGSGRMVGLNVFGEAAWALEQTLNLWLSEERKITADLRKLIHRALEDLGAWADELAQTGKSARECHTLINTALAVRSGQSLESCDQTCGPAQAVNAAPAPEAEVEAGQIIPESISFPFQASTADIAFSTTETSTIDIPSAPLILAQSSPPDDIKQIGHITLSVPLYNIYLSEADELLRRLVQDFGEWRHELDRTVSANALQAAHTLSGSAATVGLIPVRDLAYAIEAVLLYVMEHQTRVQLSDIDVLESSLESLRSMLHRFAAETEPPPDQQHLTALQTLLETVKARQTSSVAPATVMSVTPSAPIISSLPDDRRQARQVVHDEIDSSLLEIFVQEANEYLPQIGKQLRLWQQQSKNLAIAQDLLRQLHTVKGGARMAGAMRLGEAIHHLESGVESGSALTEIPETLFEELINTYDRVMELFDVLTHPQNSATQAPLQIAQEISSSETIETLEPKAELPETAEIMPTAQPVNIAQAQATNRLTSVQAVRIRADMLDTLVNQAGEVTVSRSRLENEVSIIKSSLGDLTENVVRLRSQLREIEIQAESQMQSRFSVAKDREQFDPLEFDRFTRFQELTRMMAESVNDVATVQQNLLKSVDHANQDLNAQKRLTRDLQQNLMRVRMIPFGSISERLYRVVRQAAKETNKRVNLDIRGSTVEIDRSILERMISPFEHLLRNAIVHGIETREARRQAGKAETGELTIEVRHEGNEIVLMFNDDGAGLNLPRIRAKAIEAGLINPDEDLSDSHIADLIFQPGLSTASELTALAGRGVGMDVVRAEASNLGGRIGVETTVGAGTYFKINLPLTLAVTQIVLVNVGGRTYALPSILVEQVQQLRPQNLAQAYNQGYIGWNGQNVKLHFLPTLLGIRNQAPIAQRYSPVIVLRSGKDYVALHVDEVIGNQEVVIKNIGPQLSRMVGIAGATVLGSGEVILILNPLQLARRISEHGPLSLAPATGGAVAEFNMESPTGPISSAPILELETQPAVMVVDDSLTVRKVTQRLLLRQGYQVVLAKDGVDALQKLQDYTPDVMLVDIEMPRMDGFDLTRNVRSDERYRHIPIIMITSRTADKHRRYAIEIGANLYLGKPYQEDELVGHIASFMQNRKATRSS